MAPLSGRQYGGCIISLSINHFTPGDQSCASAWRHAASPTVTSIRAKTSLRLWHPSCWQAWQISSWPRSRLPCFQPANSFVSSRPRPAHNSNSFACARSCFSWPSSRAPWTARHFSGSKAVYKAAATSVGAHTPPAAARRAPRSWVVRLHGVAPGGNPRRPASAHARAQTRAQTDRDGQAGRQADGRTDGRADGRPDRRTDRQTDKQTVRSGQDRQPDRQAGRQAGRQADRQTDTHTHMTTPARPRNPPICCRREGYFF